MTTQTKILFICVHNSGRSQIAETFLKSLGGDRFQVESAGLEPTEVDPNVIEVMNEIGFDLTGKKTNSVFDFYKQGRLYDYVVTVCDESVEGMCPIFPGINKRLHWPFPDPKKVEGTREEKLVKIRKIRDDIKKRVKTWLEEFK